MSPTTVPLSDLPPGSIKQVEHEGKQVALCNAGGTCYAIQDRCPHLRAKLSEGHLEGETVVCPWHQGQFDLKTGEPRVWVAQPRLLHLVAKLMPPFLRRAKTYSVRVEGENIIIE